MFPLVAIVNVVESGWRCCALSVVVQVVVGRLHTPVCSSLLLLSCICSVLLRCGLVQVVAGLPRGVSAMRLGRCVGRIWPCWVSTPRSLLGCRTREVGTCTSLVLLHLRVRMLWKCRLFSQPSRCCNWVWEVPAVRKRLVLRHRSLCSHVELVAFVTQHPSWLYDVASLWGGQRVDADLDVNLLFLHREDLLFHSFNCFLLVGSFGVVHSWF